MVLEPEILQPTSITKTIPWCTYSTKRVEFFASIFFWGGEGVLPLPRLVVLGNKTPSKYPGRWGQCLCFLAGSGNRR